MSSNASTTVADHSYVLRAENPSSGVLELGGAADRPLENLESLSNKSPASHALRSTDSHSR